MAILKISQDTEFLRQKSKPVDTFDARLHTLLNDMHDTLHNAEGAGLAAPQIGVLWRVALVKASELINPEIIASSKPKKGEEMCLSIPGIPVDVIRPQRVKIRYQDRFGTPQTMELRGIDAIIACHEIDHLNGVLVTDYAGVK